MQKLDDLLQTQMTRKQFLRTIGASLLVICGLPTLLHILNYQGTPQKSSGDDGYGTGNYGGVGLPSSQPSFGHNNSALSNR